jgi:DNA-binding transcriptional LysR family regulator
MSLGFISHPDAKHHAQLLLSENFNEFKHIDQFPRHGFSNQISLILEPVSRGLGFTILPHQAALAFNKQNEICIHTLATPVSETLYLCYHQKKPLPARVKALVVTMAKFCRSSFQFN